MDRVQLAEVLAEGQRVRNYTIEVAAGPLLPWAPLLSGAAIGRKRIHLFTAPVPAGATLRLRVTHAIATPRRQGFGAFAPCPDM